MDNHDIIISDLRKENLFLRSQRDRLLEESNVNKVDIWDQIRNKQRISELQVDYETVQKEKHALSNEYEIIKAKNEDLYRKNSILECKLLKVKGLNQITVAKCESIIKDNCDLKFKLKENELKLESNLSEVQSLKNRNDKLNSQLADVTKLLRNLQAREKAEKERRIQKRERKKQILQAKLIRRAKKKKSIMNMNSKILEMDHGNNMNIKSPVSPETTGTEETEAASSYFDDDNNSYLSQEVQTPSSVVKKGVQSRRSVIDSNGYTGYTRSVTHGRSVDRRDKNNRKGTRRRHSYGDHGYEFEYDNIDGCKQDCYVGCGFPFMFYPTSTTNTTNVATNVTSQTVV